MPQTRSLLIISPLLLAILFIFQFSVEAVESENSDFAPSDVSRLNEQLKKGDTAALHTLYDLATQGDDSANAVLKSFRSDMLNPEDLSVRKAFREMDASKFIEQANKGDVLAIHVLMVLDSYNNVSAIKALGKMDMTDFITKAQNGDAEAFTILSLMVFRNSQATLAISQLDMNKMTDQVDIVKDQNAMGKLAIMAMMNPSADTAGKMEKKLQTTDPEDLIVEANKGNYSSLEVLLTQCRAGNKAALNVIKKFNNMDEIIETAKQGNRGRLHQLLSLHSFDNPIAQKSFQDNDFSALFVEHIHQGKKDAVEMLSWLLNRKLATQEDYKKIDTSRLVEKANQGDRSAVSTLVSLVYQFKDDSVKEQITKIDTDVFVEQANQGSHDAIKILKSLYHSLYSYDNSSVKEAFNKINPEKYVHAAQEGDSSAFYSLRVLAAYRNSAAHAALTKLAQDGSADAQRALENVKIDKTKTIWK